MLDITRIFCRIIHVESANEALLDIDRLTFADLRSLVLEQQTQITSQHEQLLAKDGELRLHKSEIALLKLQLAKLRRLQFGRKSEKLDRQIEQLELRLEELETTDAERACITTEKAPRRSAASPKPRRTFPDHLPRETRIIAPPHDACPQCGGTFKHLGDDASDILEFVPAHFKVIHLVRPKLACTHCDHIDQATAPPRPIERGMAGPGLLAHVLVSKYADHCPLYRQSEIYAREGVDLDRSFLADCVGGASALLAPLAQALRKYVLAADVIHSDDTPMPVLDPGRGKTKTGRLWTYVRDERPAAGGAAPAVWFAYSSNRNGEHPARHLEGFTGILQADAYAGYSKIYEGGRVREAACMAHARRHFFDLYEANQSPVAAEALEHIGALYAIEREIRGRPPEERRAVRQERARPLLDAMHEWLLDTLKALSQKSAMAKAIRYALNRWDALVRYCDDGRIEIDNNAAERSLRCVALGRKNYLFAGSDAGGERAAVIYSLLGTAKLNGFNPQAYLREVLARIAEHPITHIGELLPWNLPTPEVAQITESVAALPELPA